MMGQAAIAMWCDVPGEARAEFEDWHVHEHMPERLSIPGFLRGTRWAAASGESSFFILYELDGLATLTGPAYLERLNNPTPWSRRMMPHHRNMVRSLCAVRAGFGGGLSSALATIRFTEDIPSVKTQLGSLPAGKGISSAHLLEAQPMPAAQTTEQKIRGGDARADWVVLVGGYDADAVRDAAHGLHVPGALVGLYAPVYSLSAGE